MTDCDILMYLFAAFSVAGCGWIFIAARIRQRYIDEIKHLKESNDVYERLFKNMSEEIQCEERRFSGLWEQFAALAKTNQELVESLSDVLAHLVAAHSLLQRGGKKAAPSDTMFMQMLKDYEKSINNGRTILAKHKEQA